MPNALTFSFKSSVIVLALTVSTVCMFRPLQDGTVPNHLGGNIFQTGEFIHNHAEPVILNGYYFSAGAMWLGHHDACATPDSVFGFHGPHYNGKPPTQEVYDVAINLMAAFYPEPIKSLFLKESAETGLHSIRNYTVFTGAELIAIGVIDQCRA